MINSLPAFDAGVGGADLLPFGPPFDLLYVLPPLAETGVCIGLLARLVYPGLLVQSL